MGRLMGPVRGWFTSQLLGPNSSTHPDELGHQSWPFLRIGHRGAAGLEPENTLRGIETALRFGVDMVEVDVRPCADGALLVIHDDDLKRGTGRRGRCSTTPLDHRNTRDSRKRVHIPPLLQLR